MSTYENVKRQTKYGTQTQRKQKKYKVIQKIFPCQEIQKTPERE